LPSEKITLIDNRILVSGTDEVGLHQRFCHVVSTFSQQNRFSQSIQKIELATQLARDALIQFGQTFVMKGQVGYGALLAFASGSEFNLCEFAVGSFDPEFKTEDRWFASIGSGQLITDPFLGFLQKIFWPSTRRRAPSTKEGVFFAAWALTHAIELNPGGINGPIKLAILKASDQGTTARLLDESETAEHKNSVISAEDCLRSYAQELRGETKLSVSIEIPLPEINDY
jgi:hypothetical protein